MESMEVFKFLEKLDLNGVEIARALDKSKISKTIDVIKENPQITKRELMEKVGIEGYIY